ncbi:MAG: DNA adenine methylase [Anaerolineales bacterium]|nr:MAG: DNA adenine methylase [Anaerolineales bacterium]
MSKATKRASETQINYSLNLVVASATAKPFLKWAGGKGQLIESLSNLLPVEMRTGEIKKYAEPFIGGGALFFYVAQNYPQIEKFYISDANQELVLAYTTIQKDVESLISFLAVLEKKYHALDNFAQKEFFYEQRKKFNEKLLTIDYINFGADWVERTAEIIFLNRTCFNGLFRVNSKGEFNVPFGDYKNPRICDTDNLRAVSALLQKTEIKLGDFTASDKFIDSSTFVYFDPPYRPISKTASFNSYSKFEFGDEAQKRLAEYYALLSKKKAKLMLSNSDPKNEDPNDHFFEDLYKDFRVERVDASRNINSNASKRGKIKELVIVNY